MKRHRSLLRCALLVVVLGLVHSNTLEAQVPRGLRGAVKGAERILNKPESSTTPAQAPAGSPAAQQGSSAPAVLEISSEVLDRLVLALQAEADKRLEPRKYEACQQETTSGPDAQKLTEQYGNEVEAARTEQEKMAAYQRWIEYLQRLTREKCGESPGSSHQKFEMAGATAGQFTERQYAVLKERILPFCGDTAVATATAAEHVKVQVYSYKPDEAAVLRVRCGEFRQLLSSTS
jgi:hypothetical protein